jgi:hypothetical protein
MASIGSSSAFFVFDKVSSKIVQLASKPAVPSRNAANE